MKNTIIFVGALLIVGGGIVAWTILSAPSEKEKGEFYSALRQGDLDKLKTMAAANPRLLNARYDKNTPLEDACCIYSPVKNRNDIVQFMLEQGTDPNVDGGACLNGAIYSNDSTCIRLLLEHGADPLIKGPEGKTPLDMAKYYDVKGIPELLQEYIDKKK